MAERAVEASGDIGDVVERQIEGDANAINCQQAAAAGAELETASTSSASRVYEMSYCANNWRRREGEVMNGVGRDEWKMVDVTEPTTAIFTHVSALPAEREGVSTEAIAEGVSHMTLDGLSANEVTNLAALIPESDLNWRMSNLHDFDERDYDADDGFVDAVGDNDGDGDDALLMAFVGTGTFRARGGADEARRSGNRDYGMSPAPDVENQLHSTDFDSDSYLENTEGIFISKQQLTRQPLSDSQAHNHQRLTFEDWLAAKKKMDAIRDAERRSSARDYKRAAEQRRRLSAQKYDEWLINKARQARESLLARCAINTNQLVRARRPHEYLTTAEMRQRVEEWERRKIVESEQKREQDKQNAQAERESVERRQRQAQQAWELWIAERSHSSRSSPSSRSALHSKNVSAIYVNPNGWHGGSYRASRPHRHFGRGQQAQQNYEKQRQHLQHQQQLQHNHQQYLKHQQYKQQQQQQQQQQENYQQYLQHEE